MSSLEDYKKRFAHMQTFQDQVGTQGGGYNPAQSINEPGGQKPHPSMDGGPVRLDAPPPAPGTHPGMIGPPAWQGPPPGGQQGYAPQQGGMGPASIYDVFNSAVPLMNANRDKQIGQSMANAGMSGTRFGTAAQNNVARIGADTALQQDQLLTNLLYQQGQSDADRSLQATGQAMNLAQIYDEMQRNRINQLNQVGMWEQGRGDALNMLPYQDFMASRLGYLPQIMQGVTGQGAMPQGQSPIQTTIPGQPGFADYAMLAAAIYGMAGSDKRLKKDIVRLDREAIPGVPFATWRWKWNDKEAFGVIADDLEEVRPDLVVEIGGVKHVRYRELMEVA